MEVMNKVEAVEAFTDYELLDSTDEIFFARAGIDGAITRLKEIKKELDEHLISVMKNKKIESFEYGEKGDRTLISYGQKKKEKIKDPRVLRKMLFSEDAGEREMSIMALSGGQSAWKTAKVRELQDTLGLDLIETTYEDQVVVKTIPIDQLNRKKLMENC